MKKLASTALALTLAASLGSTALAANGLTAMPISAKVGYSHTITVNGTKLDTSKLPAAPAGAVSIPLRAVAEADYGFADWYPDEQQSFFSLDGNTVYVSTANGAITVNSEEVSGMTASFVEGVTYVPVEVLNRLDGYKAQVKDSSITVTSPNGETLTKLARQILSQIECGATMKQSSEDMEAFAGITAANFDEVVGFFPMMTSPDTLIIGKVKSGKLSAVEAEFETYRQAQEDTFTWYLGQHLPKVQAAKVVTQGDYVMFIIAEDTDTATKLFKAGVK